MAERPSIAASPAEVRAAPALDIQAEVVALELLIARQLRDRFAEVFREEARSNNRVWLIKRIAWRIQANAWGGLSERALQRAREIANDADVRLMAPKSLICPPQSGTADTRHHMFSARRGDRRLPKPGSAIVRQYKGRAIRVIVLENEGGFEWEGERYASLTAIAKKVTGSHINGFRFFRLKEAA